MITKLQNTILEMIATGAPLGETIDVLCRNVEAMVPDIVCSVLTLDEEKRVRHLSSPSLPAAYAQAIDGVKIGPGVGSCGTAAYTGKPVIVSDIETHPYWKDFKALALPLGLLACWSSPIIASDKVLGTFAFYYRTKRAPTDLEQEVVDACTYLCAIAIERDLRIAEALRLSETDALTGLFNRGTFNRELAAKASTSETWGVLIADLDNLKIVNDRFGHRAGDDLIRETSARILQVGRAGMCFRLGGDEFAVLVEGAGQLGASARQMIEAMRAPVECDGQMIHPSLTIGGATAGADEAPEQVRQKADYALYHAKERARGTYVEYAPGLGSAIIRRFRAIQDLTEALHADRVEPYYQPIVALATGEIVGLEALCRMIAPNGEILAAASFQEATRDGNAAAELTRRMLAMVAADARRWMDMGLNFGRVGINLSAADFYREGLADRVANAFAEAGVPVRNVTLEVTESVYLDQRDQTVAQQICEMRAAGMNVALDDFGTGYASLTHLLSVPVDIIKIDKSFVRRATQDRHGSVIIKGLVDIARGLDIKVVAEGIETIEQAGMLLRLGCQRGQGYLFSRPLDRRATTDLLKCHPTSAWLETGKQGTAATG